MNGSAHLDQKTLVDPSEPVTGETVTGETVTGEPGTGSTGTGEPRLAGQGSKLLRGLNDAQRSAVTSDASPLRILAGAGSGKTRVLTHRIAYRASTGQADPARVLAVTFTRKAASELRSRLNRLGLRKAVQAGTFHAIAWAQLRQRWEERGIRPPELLDRKLSTVARVCPGRSRTLPLDIVSEIEWASARLVDPERYAAMASAAHRRPPVDLSAVAEIYSRYVEIKKQRRQIDFDDLLRLAARDLEADPVYATARRWRFRDLYVDEFQDVNPLQHKLLSAWLGPESSLCVVGDPNQAIYAWNGADARLLVDFERFHPGAHTVKLADNYRSTPEILSAANAVLAGGSAQMSRMRSNRPSGKRPTIRSFDDEVAEARGVVRACRDRHHPGAPWNTQAVLVRTNAQSTALAEAFGAAGIPHRVRGAGSLLNQPEIKQALSELRRARSLSDFVADCERTARLGDTDAEDPGSTGGDATRGDPPGDGPPDDLRSDAGQPDVVALSEDRRGNMAELVRLGHEYMALDSTAGKEDFGRWLRSTLRDSDVSGDAVEIVTFHAAKGLEWSVVHVAGMEKGYVPIHHAGEDPEAIEEERRLLYVALTRARDELHCTSATSRTFGNRSARRTPSPWLDDMRMGIGGPARSTRRDPTATAATKAALREQAMPPDADRALFESLREWRRAQAATADVPAFVVFNDATLHAVAAARPTTKAELLAIAGIGAVKLERFGADLLAIVASDEHTPA